MQVTQPFAKADRLRVPVQGTACSQHNWPNFEPKCQFDIRETAGERARRSGHRAALGVPTLVRLNPDWTTK